MGAAPLRRPTQIALVVAAAAAFFVAGLALAQVSTEPTVETRTFTNIVTYTIPTETVTTVETVTVTAPTTTEPPPQGGTTLRFVDQQWRCSQSIASLATNGLPLRVTLDFTRPFVPSSGGGVAFLGNGCNGDGNPATVDLVLDVRGDGRTFGPGDDAVRFANAVPGPRDLVITGHADCGPRVGAAHQDGFQILGGLNVEVRDFTVGNYDAGRATCQGAGGAFFYSGDSTNVDVVRGKYIACNHGLLAGWPSPGANVTGVSFRTGPAPVCVQPETFFASRPCDIRAEWGGTTSGLTCQRWNGTSWENVP